MRSDMSRLNSAVMRNDSGSRAPSRMLPSASSTAGGATGSGGALMGTVVGSGPTSLAAAIAGQPPPYEARVEPAMPQPDDFTNPVYRWHNKFVTARQVRCGASRRPQRLLAN